MQILFLFQCFFLTLIFVYPVQANIPKGYEVLSSAQQGGGSKQRLEIKAVALLKKIFSQDVGTANKLNTHQNKEQQMNKGTSKTSANYPIKPKQDKTPSVLIDFKVEKYFLKNGMTILLHEDRRIPQIYHQLLVKVGSKDEKKGKTGLAHLFEHMMFRGTNKYTGEEYEERLASIGATNNAFTSRDYTAYEVTLPSHKLEMVLEMEAERLKSLRLTQSYLDKEVEVVKEERRETTDNNPNEIFEPIMKLIFKSHPYGRPIIGWMRDLEKMSLKDCKKFYQSYYAPNNSILVLVGNFEVKKAKKWIQKYYGALKPSHLEKKSFPSLFCTNKTKKGHIKKSSSCSYFSFCIQRA